MSVGWKVYLDYVPVWISQKAVRHGVDDTIQLLSCIEAKAVMDVIMVYVTADPITVFNLRPTTTCLVSISGNERL